MISDSGNRYMIQRNTQLAEKIIKDHNLTAAQATIITDAISKQFSTPETLKKTSSVELSKIYADKVNEPIKFSGLPTGIKTLDEELLGVKRKDLFIIGAATGVGKSTLALFFLANFSQLGYRCLYLAFEDSEMDLGTRYKRMINSNSYMSDKYSILPAIEAYVKTESYDIICLDMLNNLVDTNNDRDASEFINALRSLATKLGIVIVVTCRLRKPQDKEETLHPSKYSFSGKSDITYSATKIITLAPSEFDFEQDVVLIDSQKNRIRDRNKPRKRTKVRIDNEFKFTDLGGLGYASDNKR